MTALRIAMIGTRGLPATFGGIERHVEELGARLVARGHEVTVYSRPAYTGDRALTEHRGMRLVQVPTVRRSGAEALVHSALSAAAVVTRDCDVAHFHALGPGLFTFVPRAFSSAAVVQTIHGLDDARAKWGGAASGVLRVGGWLSARVPDEVVVVSEDLERHYRTSHGRASTYVPNGAPEPRAGDAALLREAFGLAAGDYALFVGRLVPEKDPELLVRAFRRLATTKKLVVVGGSAHTDDYVAALRESAAGDDRVRLVGFRYGDELAALLAHAGLFVQPSRLEGLPITLLEAAAYGRPVLASDIPPHVEVVGAPRAGKDLFRTGDEESLLAGLRRALDDEPGLRAGADELQDDVRARYSWDAATEQLEEVYRRAVTRRRERRRGSRSAS